MLRQLLPADLAARLFVSDPAAIERQSLELGLRPSTVSGHHPESHLPTKQLAANKPPHVVAQPQIYVKQGVSKCRECNIVFCKHENYIAHKKHYCSSRMTDDTTDTSAKPSPPTSPTANNANAAAAAATTGGGNGAIAAPTLAYQQLICAACGIKFTSLDNLNAHQMYYCPKRVDAAVAMPPKDKCAKCKATHDPSVACTGSASSTSFSHNAGVYKCPMCDVISVNASDLRRHLETHTSIKAYRCSICRYRGNTLRGMRTHIRMHFDKKSSDLNEEHYISCIVEDDGSDINQQPAAPLTVAQAPSTNKEGTTTSVVNAEMHPGVITNANTSAYR